jgi:hypothetical protein
MHCNVIATGTSTFSVMLRRVQSAKSAAKPARDPPSSLLSHRRVGDKTRGSTFSSRPDRDHPLQTNYPLQPSFRPPTTSPTVSSTHPGLSAPHQPSLYLAAPPHALLLISAL